MTFGSNFLPFQHAPEDPVRETNKENLRLSIETNKEEEGVRRKIIICRMWFPNVNQS